MKISSEKILWKIFNLIGDIDKCLTYIPRSIYYANNIEYYHFLQKLRRGRDRRKFCWFIDYLKKKNYIKLKKEQNKKFILLTQKGQDKILNIYIKKAKRKRRSDEKSVLIIFDIPEALRKSRNFLRVNLKIMGYQMIQQSAWLSPYDVLEITQKLIKQYDIKKYVKIFLVSKSMEIKNRC